MYSRQQWRGKISIANKFINIGSAFRSMSATTTLNAPQGEVDALIQEAADKAGYLFFKSIYNIA